MAQSPSFRSSAMLLVQRNPWVMALSCLPMVAALAVSAAVGLPPLVLLAALLGVAGPWLAYERNPWPIAKQVTVQAEPSGVQIEDRYVPRSEIREGFILPGAAPWALLVRGFGKLPIVLQSATKTEARADRGGLSPPGSPGTTSSGIAPGPAVTPQHLERTAGRNEGARKLLGVAGARCAGA